MSKAALGSSSSFLALGAILVDLCQHSQGQDVEWYQNPRSQQSQIVPGAKKRRFLRVNDRVVNPSVCDCSWNSVNPATALIRRAIPSSSSDWTTQIYRKGQLPRYATTSYSALDSY
ncbi:hypothetical protein M426DRAFT_115141 [Hypoxylon sp. CI-4A]|nr:hypothetical protein M426DRAFT_115141 [Hypoxylon sp. CI-4A]